MTAGAAALVAACGSKPGEVADDGSVTVDITAPAELAEMLTMVGKLTARAAAKKRDDGLPPWPPRVLRWKGPGRGE